MSGSVKDPQVETFSGDPPVTMRARIGPVGKVKMGMLKVRHPVSGKASHRSVDASPTASSLASALGASPDRK